ncbi:MAG TPA: hypothetical protein VER96_35200 [Polyangiaceae bacterium]|nr:hypothetical protein [Polyangiaceae bacterium]
MSRRSKRTDPKSGKGAPQSGKPERRHPPRRALAPLPEVVLARRPVSANPTPVRTEAAPAVTTATPNAEASPVATKRAARIVGAPAAVDEAELERRHLLSRLLESEGPAAVTRAANAYRKGGFQFPEEQLVQLKLLEHSDEAEVCSALAVLTSLLDQQPPIKLPVFEQRLKRLEDGAEEAETRVRAAELRRVLRT